MNDTNLDQKKYFQERAIINGNTQLRFSHYIFALALFAKQFYLLPSGSFQIGDALFVFSLLCFFINSRGVIIFRRKDYPIYAYVVCIAIINLTYSIIERYNFNKSTLYYLYSLIIIITFVNLNTKQVSSAFLGLLSIISKCSLCLQLLLLVTGFGRWYAASRYEGTFNDPNQYGVFVLFSLFLIFLIDKDRNKKVIFWILLGTFLIVISASTGNLLGLAAFFVICLFNEMKKDTLSSMLLPILALLFFTFWLAVMCGLIEIKIPTFNNSILNRMANKINNIFASEGVDSIISDRGWARVFEYPEYILFGSGEGYYSRFGVTLEIHSSVLGPLFYYGIIPYSLCIIWFINKIRKLDKKKLCVFVGLFFESFFLINTRQPLYWILFLIAEAISENVKPEQEQKEILW